MRVHDLIEMKEYFVGEMKPNFHVIYEKFEESDAVYVGGTVQTNKMGVEEFVQILQGDGTLRNIVKYPIGEEYPNVESALEKVKEMHKDIFLH